MFFCGAGLVGIGIFRSDDAARNGLLRYRNRCKALSCWELRVGGRGHLSALSLRSAVWRTPPVRQRCGLSGTAEISLCGTLEHR